VNLCWDRSRPHHVALIEAATGHAVTHGELEQAALARAGGVREQAGPQGLVFLFVRNDIESVVSYLACRFAGVAAALLEPSLSDERVVDLLDRYRPEVVLGRDVPAFEGGPVAPVHPELRLLLSTSGSTGSPKLVRLSGRAVDHNAAAIAEALRIGPDEVAPTSLPLPYAYGLSVLNSHLAVGATLLLTDEGVTSEAFWGACAKHGATSLAGVPYAWQVLHRLGLGRLAPPSMVTFTQAGGRLEPRLVEWAHGVARERGGRFFVMYGQTEATARIAILAPDELEANPGAVGRPLRDGALSIEDGEVVYRGPNVMMGYASGRADLGRHDELGGVLRTGDLGTLDDRGILRITGRVKRIAKVFGNRVSLDEIEEVARRVTGLPRVAATRSGDRVRLHVVADGDVDAVAVRRGLAEATRLHASGFEVETVEAIPRLSSGKVDYAALEALCSTTA